MKIQKINQIGLITTNILNIKDKFFAIFVMVREIQKLNNKFAIHVKEQEKRRIVYLEKNRYAILAKDKVIFNHSLARAAKEKD